MAFGDPSSVFKKVTSISEGVNTAVGVKKWIDPDAGGGLGGMAAGALSGGLGGLAGGLGGKLGTFAVALATLLREDKRYEEHKSLIESAVITYLKETNQYNNILNEQGDIIPVMIQQHPHSSCFGIDIYEKDGNLISENEYAKTL